MGKRRIPGFSRKDLSAQQQLKKLINGDKGPEKEDELDKWFRENPLSEPGSNKEKKDQKQED